MNLKFFLRGLGLGIVLTAIIMTVAASGRKATLTNDEIKAKAKELGMIEDKVLTDYMAEVNQKADEEETMPEQETVPKEEETELESKEDAAEDIEEEPPGDAALNQADDLQLEEGMTKENEEPTIFSVKRGESPYSISVRLQENGLITSADDFDTFLLNNGYDRRIVAAEYKIPVDADEETIAKIITGQKIE